MAVRADGFPRRHGRQRLHLPDQALCPGVQREAALFDDSEAEIEAKALMG